MVCGHCGTAINQGFSTCPACGAVYRRRSGLWPSFVTVVGGALIAGAAVQYVNGRPGDQGIAFVVGFAGLLIVWLGLTLKRWTPFQWYRQER